MNTAVTFLISLVAGLLLADASRGPAPRANMGMQDTVCVSCSTKCAAYCHGDKLCMCEDVSSNCRCFRRCTNGPDGSGICACIDGDGC